MLDTLRTLVTSDKAQSLIEFALFFPFIGFFLFATVDFGIALDRKVIFTNAAREGARYASLGTTTDADAIAQVVVDQSQGAFDTTDVNVYWVDKNGDGKVTAGEPVVVQIEYTYDLPIIDGFPLLGGSVPSIDLGACTDMALVQDPILPSGSVSAPGEVPCGGT